MNQNNTNSLETQIETAGISALSAASKTPFKTAFMLTLGIGLARAVLFFGTLAAILVVVKVLFL
jgi:hypothetical protein